MSDKTESMSDKAEEMSDKIEEMSDNLNARQKTIYSYVMKESHISSKQAAELLSVSAQTARRSLNEMVKLGLLKPEGKNKGRRYLVIKN